MRDTVGNRVNPCTGTLPTSSSTRNRSWRCPVPRNCAVSIYSQTLSCLCVLLNRDTAITEKHMSIRVMRVALAVAALDFSPQPPTRRMRVPTSPRPGPASSDRGTRPLHVLWASRSRRSAGNRLSGCTLSCSGLTTLARAQSRRGHWAFDTSGFTAALPLSLPRGCDLSHSMSRNRNVKTPKCS